MFKKRVKKYFSFLLAFGLLVASLPAAADTDAAPEAAAASETKQLMAVVKYTQYGRINLRAEPNGNSFRIGVLSPGTLVRVCDQGTGRWTLVEGDGKIGYISTNFLEFFYEGETPPISVKDGATTVVSADTYSSSSYPTTPVKVVSWPVTESTAMYVNTANGKNLNLRAGPSTDYAAIGSYQVGTSVLVLARKGIWAYVSVGSRTGFMMLTYLSEFSPDPVYPPVPQPSPVGVATVVHPWGSYVNLRSTTSTDTSANILAQVPSGSRVEVLSWGYWYSLVRYRGITGYMVTSYLSGSATPDPDIAGIGTPAKDKK